MNLSDRRIVGDLTPHVQPIAKRVPPRAVRTEQEYDTATASMNRLLDAGAADEAHPLAELVATRGELISNYDALHYPATYIAPMEVLRALMDQHGLTQSELAQELGSQGVVAENLSGKRAMNLRQMRALATRFSLPVAAFVSGATVVME